VTPGDYFLFADNTATDTGSDGVVHQHRSERARANAQRIYDPKK
jgi:hypothetical protein